MGRDIIEIRCHGISEQMNIIMIFLFVEVKIKGRK